MDLSTEKLKERISDDYYTATKQLAEMGYSTRELPDSGAARRAEEEEEERDEIVEDSFWDNFWVPTVQVASGTSQLVTETVASVGVINSWIKGKVGLSDDPRDTWLYQAGTALTEAAEYESLPNRFKGGTRGFLLSDAPKGVGSAIGFAGTGGVAGVVGKGAAKVFAGAALKKVAATGGSRSALKRLVKEQGEELAKLKHAPKVDKKLYNKKALENIRKQSDELNARIAKGEKIGQYVGVGQTGQLVQSMEGYRDAIRHLREQAIAAGRDPDSIDTTKAMQAYWGNAPAGYFELFGVSLPILRAMKGAATTKDIAKHGADNLARKTWAHRSAVQLYSNLDRVSGGRFTRGLTAFTSKTNGSKWLHRGAYVSANATREFLQEGAQAAWMNMVASDIAAYDKNRQLFDNVLHSGGVGGVVGTVFGLAGLILGRKRQTLMKIENLESRALQLKDAGNEEGATRLQGEANELRQQALATEFRNIAAVDTSIDEAESGKPDVSVAETITPDPKDVTLDLSEETEPGTSAHTEAVERKVLSESKEVADALREEATPDEDLLGWAGVPTVGRAAPTAETVQAAKDAGVPLSSVIPTKGGKITNGRVLAAIERKGKQDEFEAKHTETQTDDQIAKAVNKAQKTGGELATVKRKGSPNAKDGKVYQVVALDKNGKEIAKLSPLMTQTEATAFMHGPIQRTWSGMTARTETKTGGKGARRSYDESFSREIQTEETAGVKDAITPERTAFKERFRGKADPKHFKEEESRSSEEIKESVEERKKKEDPAYNAAEDAAVEATRKNAADAAASSAEGVATAGKPAKKRAVSPAVKAKAAKAADKVREEQDYIDSLNEQLGDIPLTPEQEAAAREEFREEAEAGQPLTDTELAARAEMNKLKEELTEPPSEERKAALGKEVGQIFEEEEAAPAEGSLEAQAAELRAKMRKNLGDIIDPSAMSMGGVGVVNAKAVAELTVNGTQLGVVYAKMGIGSFKAWSKKMIEDFGEGIRPYLKRIYKGVDQAAQDEGVAGTEELTNKEMDKQLKELDKKPAKKKPAKKTDVKSQQQQKRKKKAAAVKNKVDPDDKLPPSPRQVATGDETATTSDLKDSMGSTPVITNLESEERVGDVEDMGPFKNKGLATAHRNKKAKKNTDRDYWVVTNKDGTHSIHSETKAPAVEIIREDDISPLDASLKKRERENHEEALDRLKPADVTTVEAGSPAMREEEELREDTEEELALKANKAKAVGKLKTATDPNVRRALQETIFEIDLELKGLVKDAPPTRGVRGDDTIFRGDHKAIDSDTRIPELQPEALEKEVSVGPPASGSDAVVKASVVASPDEHFIGNAKVEFNVGRNKEIPADAHPDIADINSMGVSKVLKQRLIALIEQDGLFEGLPVLHIEFRTSSMGAPMFTMPETGQDTIYVDLDRLAHIMSGPQDLVSYSEGIKKTFKKDAPTLTEMLDHELQHVTLWRAIHKGYTKINKGGKAADLNEGDLGEAFRRIHRRNTEVLEMMLARGEGQLMLDELRSHMAKHFGQELAEQLHWDAGIQQQVSKKDANGKVITHDGRPVREGGVAVKVNKPYKGQLVGGEASQYQRGVEWLVFLMEYAGQDKTLPSGGYETIKYTSKKYLEYISLLMDKDVSAHEFIPPGVRSMMAKAALLTGRVNAFAKKLSYLEDAGAIHRLGEAHDEITKHKVGEKHSSREGYGERTEKVREQEYLSYLWNYMATEAAKLGELLDALSPSMPTGTGQIHKKDAADGWETMSVEQDWHSKGAPRAVRVSDINTWSQTWAGLAKHTGNNLADLRKNNPHLPKAGVFPPGSWVLVYSTDKYSYGVGRAEINWYESAKKYADGVNRKDSSAVAADVELVFDRLAEGVQLGGHLSELSHLTVASAETGEVARRGKDQAEIEFAGEREGGSSEAIPTQGAASHEVVNQQIAVDTINDLLMGKLADGTDVFSPIRVLDFFLSPATMSYGIRAIASNMTEAGVINWDRAAVMLQAYHNTRVDAYEKIEKSIAESENLIEQLETDKPKGYTVLLKQAKANLNKHKARLATNKATYFQGTKPLDTSITGLDLERTIMPAFGGAMASINVTRENFWRLFETARSDMAEKLDELMFPTEFTDGADMIANIVMDSVEATAKDGRSEYETRTVKGVGAVHDEVSNWVRTGDTSSTEAGTSVREIMERARSIIGTFISKDGDQSVMDKHGWVLADRQAIYKGVETALTQARRKAWLNATLEDVEADRAELIEMEKWVVQYGGNISSQAGQAMRLKKELNEAGSHLLARKGYERAIRKHNKKHFGGLIDIDWVASFKSLIRKAGDAAGFSAIAEWEKQGGINPIDPMVESGTFSFGARADYTGERLDVNTFRDKLYSAVQHAMNSMSKTDTVNADVFIKEFETAMANKDIAFTGSSAQMKKVANHMLQVWRRQRVEELRKVIVNEHGTLIGGKITLDVLLKSVDRILPASDAGLFGSLNKGHHKVDGVDVEAVVVEMWDKLAPAAFKTENGFSGDPISMKLMEMEENIERSGLKGVRLAELQEEMVRYILENRPVDYVTLARDVWFAGALSGVRTWVDIGTGSALHGAISTILLSAEASLVTGRNKGDGLKIMNAFVHGLWEGLDGFVYIVKEGDLSKLPDANERLQQMLDSQSDYYGGMELEKYAKGGENKAGRKYAGVLKFVRRIVLGLDYIGATGGRKAMMVYGASTRSEATRQAIASETNPAVKKQLIEQGKKLDAAYEAGTKLTNKASKDAALAQAVREIHGEKYSTEISDADIKKHSKEPLVKARAREIMEKDIEAAEDITHSAAELGRVFALNADPVGLGGVVHRVLQKFTIFKYPFGMAFSRAAMNMASNASNMIPVLGLVNYARTRDNAMTRFLANQDWTKKAGLQIQPGTKVNPNQTEHGKEVMSKERANLIRAQAITGTGLGIALLGALAFKDDEDEENLWDITGSLANLSRDKQRQLLSQGVKAYSIKIGNHYISYKNTPMAAWWTAMGTMRDGKRWGDWDERSSGEHFVDLTLGGYTYISDVGPTTQIIQLLESGNQMGDTSSTAKKVSAVLSSNWIGPIASPNLLREIDTIVSPTYYKPGKDQFFAHYLQNSVIGMRHVPGVKGRTLLNAFGEPVEIARTPWNRAYQGPASPRLFKKTADPSQRREWVLAGKWARQDVFLPTGAHGRQIVGEDLTKRDMTEAELHEYTEQVGLMLKKYIVLNIDALEKATPAMAQAWLDRTSSSIKKKAAYQISLKARRATSR